MKRAKPTPAKKAKITKKLNASARQAIARAADAQASAPQQASGMTRATYTGGTNSKGKPHGHGTRRYSDGTTHTGEWKDGKPVP